MKNWRQFVKYDLAVYCSSNARDIGVIFIRVSLYGTSCDLVQWLSSIFAIFA